MKNTLLIFLALQIADIATTSLILRMGGVETNPLVKQFLVYGPLLGLMLAKTLPVAIGGFCVLAGKQRVISLSNMVYYAVVAWNVTVLTKLMA